MLDITNGILSSFNLGDVIKAERLVNQSTQLIRVFNAYRAADSTLSYTIESGQTSGIVDLMESQYAKSYYGRANKFDSMFNDSNGIVCAPGFNLVLFDSTLQPNTAAFTANLQTLRFLIKTQLIENDGTLGTADFARGFFKQQSISQGLREPYSVMMGFHSENYRLVTPQINAVLSAAPAEDVSFNITIRRPQIVVINIATEAQRV